MREVTRYQFRWYDPLREKWILSRIKLTEDEIRAHYTDGCEILWETAERGQVLETWEERMAISTSSIPFPRRSRE